LNRLLAIPLLPAVVWNIYTTFRGISILFDLPRNPNINPGQFAFGIIVTLIVIGLVLASSLAFSNNNSEELPASVLKGAWLAAVFFNLVASWVGTKRLILYEDDDPGKKFAVLVIVTLIVLSTAFLPRLLNEKPS